MKIVFATGNLGKLREASEILGEGFELVSLADVGITEDIPETGETLRENSLQKAQYVLEHCGVNVTGTYLVCIDSSYVRGAEEADC